MKESKLGGKKHGMVLIISVGKKGDKDPTHVADPDTKKKASIDDYLQEAESMRGAGDSVNARRFSDVASAMQRGPAYEQSIIDRHGREASSIVSPEGTGEYAQLLYDEGRQSPDYMEAKREPEYFSDYVGGDDQRRAFIQAMNALHHGKQKVSDYDSRAQDMAQQLREDDPTKFFLDRRMKEGDFVKAIPPEVLGGGILAGLGGSALTHFMAWLTNRLEQDRQSQSERGPNE
tara:strand:- start:19 stop:714 length:696 start_codon:yes stop_codon:yes gene_type:complete